MHNLLNLCPHFFLLNFNFLSSYINDNMMQSLNCDLHQSEDKYDISLTELCFGDIDNMMKCCF